MEMARDVGWVMNCRTAADAFESVQRKFPVLKDIQRAYEEGAMGVAEVERPGRRDLVREFEPREGILGPGDVRVASNLDGIAVWGDEDVREDFAWSRGERLVEGGMERGRRRRKRD